jgi:hypothetical protein
MEKYRLQSRKPKLRAVEICCAEPLDTLYPQKLALTSPTSGGRSVGIVRLRARATECVVVLVVCAANSGTLKMSSFMSLSS